VTPNIARTLCDSWASFLVPPVKRRCLPERLYSEDLQHSRLHFTCIDFSLHVVESVSDDYNVLFQMHWFSAVARTRKRRTFYRHFLPWSVRSVVAFRTAFYSCLDLSLRDFLNTEFLWGLMAYRLPTVCCWWTSVLMLYCFMTAERSNYRQKSSISYRPITLVGSARMRAILTGRVFASLYCSFTPLSPTGHIAQW